MTTFAYSHCAEGTGSISSFPDSPRLLNGAVIGIHPFNPLASAVVFEYNPDTMTRRLELRAVSREVVSVESFRLTGAPNETITLSMEIDASHHPEPDNPLATTIGTCPTLAAPFSKDWHFLFKSSETTKTTRHR